MRRHWDRRDVWQIDVAEPEFSPQVARQLRDSCEQSDLESSRNSRWHTRHWTRRPRARRFPRRCRRGPQSSQRSIRACSLRF